MMNYSKQEMCPTPFPMKPMLAHAYIPYQCMSTIYETNKGLYRGTIFPELDMPMGEYDRSEMRGG